MLPSMRGRRVELESGELTDPTGRAPVTAGDLLLVAGLGQLSTHELTRKEIVIGRAESCDVVIDHRSFSRRHAVFRPGPPATVQDLGSTNGTLVGGAVLRGGEPLALIGADGFRIGPYSFVIVARAQGEAASSTGRDFLRVVDPTPRGVPGVVRDFARSGASILILGETGVGKEVLAETVHELSGRTGILTRINCAALSHTLLENELFGHEKGAFTGAHGQKIGLIEAADGGTVFLDEIGDMPLAIQAKLLRTVERREILRLGSTRPISVDVRFIAATNRDLPADVASGAFRRDLFFRLDGVTMLIPPLRERRGLIGPLALRFVEAAVGPPGGPAPRLGADVLAELEAYEWPGNVRELRTVIDRAVVLAHGGDIGVKHLTLRRGPGGKRLARPSDVPPEAAPVAAADVRHSTGPDLGAALLDAEQRADCERVQRALEECAGNQTRAAKMLGMSRTAFVTKLRIYRIPRPRT